MNARSELEQYCAFLLKIVAPHLKWEEEYQFYPGRKFRADFACAEQKIIIECEGGTYRMGRHTRGVGFRMDCTKYNLAALGGWKVLRFTKEMLEDGEAFATIKEALEEEK